MKKVISILLVMIMALSTFSIVTFGAATTNTVTKKNANYQYSISNNQVTINKYIGSSTAVTIPSKIDNKNVTAIGVKAFMGANKLKSVKIPSTVTLIDRSAFDSCVNLKSVTIPNNVKKLGNAVFFNCTRLESVTISNGVQSIGRGAFYNCASLKSVTIPSSVTSIGDYVFGDCKNLKTVTFADGCKTVASRMFLKCKKLTTVNLSDTIKSIGFKAFSNCEELRNITVPAGVTNIDKYAFENCTISSITVNFPEIKSTALSKVSLTTLTLGDNVTKIDRDALSSSNMETLYIGKNVKTIYGDSFDGVYAGKVVVDENNPYYVMKDNILYTKDMTTVVKSFDTDIKENTTLDIPETVTRIEPQAFKEKGYAGYNLPSNLQYIGESAFKGSDTFKELTIPDTVTYIGDNAFNGCYSLEKIKLPSTLKSISNGLFEDTANLKSVDIPSTVEKIGVNAFSKTTFSTLNLPSSVKAISIYAFGMDNNLKYITVDSANQNYTSVDNVLYSKDKTKLVLYPSKKSDTTYTILNGTKEIGARAFSGNSYLTNVKIPSSVNIIRGKAFITINKIKKYNVPTSVKTLGKYAIGFKEDIKVTSIIPNFNVNIYGSSNSKAHNYAVNSSVAYYTGTPKQNLTQKNIVGGKSFIFKINNTVTSDLVFTSSNQRIAKVDSKGKVTGLKKGTTTIIATNAYTNYECKVTVTSTMKNYKYTGFDDSSYTVLNEKNLNQWLKKYYAKNKSIDMTPTDNPSINCYTGQEYIYMKAITGTKRYLDDNCDDYSMYNYYNGGLKMELSRFKLSENTVLYSGTPTVACITGKSNSIRDMRKAVGKIVTIKEMVSTSIDHGVANTYAGENGGILLEIYAPTKTTVGGYIEKMSVYGNERELLLTQGSKYKVLDAGVRKVKITSFRGDETVTKYERYMKLVLV